MSDRGDYVQIKTRIFYLNSFLICLPILNNRFKSDTEWRLIHCWGARWSPPMNIERDLSVQMHTKHMRPSKYWDLVVFSSLKDTWYFKRQIFRIYICTLLFRRTLSCSDHIVSTRLEWKIAILLYTTVCICICIAHIACLCPSLQ